MTYGQSKALPLRHKLPAPERAFFHLSADEVKSTSRTRNNDWDADARKRAAAAGGNADPGQRRLHHPSPQWSSLNKLLLVPLRLYQDPQLMRSENGFKEQKPLSAAQ